MTDTDEAGGGSGVVATPREPNRTRSKAAKQASEAGAADDAAPRRVGSAEQRRVARALAAKENAKKAEEAKKRAARNKADKNANAARGNKRAITDSEDASKHGEQKSGEDKIRFYK